MKSGINITVFKVAALAAPWWWSWLTKIPAS
jgi:hypothetical protein